MRTIISATTALLFSTALASPPATQRNFVACPILQDTKTVPCWLADYQGQRYYLGIQVDASAEFYPPHLEHKVLVEGTATDDEICGGKVIKPIKISVLPELDPSCNTMLPATEQYTVPFAPRGPGPRAKLAELRAMGLRAQGASPIREQPPAPPYQSKEFTVYYDFDSEIANRYIRELSGASSYAKAIGAHHIDVIAYRGSVALSDGEILTEKDFIPRRRAKRLEETFRNLGFAADVVRVRWEETPSSASGVDDWRQRRASINVLP